MNTGQIHSQEADIDADTHIVTEIRSAHKHHIGFLLHSPSVGIEHLTIWYGVIGVACQLSPCTLNALSTKRSHTQARTLTPYLRWPCGVAVRFGFQSACCESLCNRTAPVLFWHKKTHLRAELAAVLDTHCADGRVNYSSGSELGSQVCVC